MQKNSGFTLTELLAAVVILGILMGMAVPAVTSVLRDQRNKMYVEDSIRLASKMQSKMKSDNKVIIPPLNSCVVMSLKYLDDGTFEESPYGKTYDKERSFVIAKRTDGFYKYNYYVRLVENIRSDSTDPNNFRGINLIPIDDDGSGTYLYMKNAKNKVDNFNDTLIKPLSDYITGSNPDGLPISMSLKGLVTSCNNVVVWG